jgi:predicted  nucleic acid-binding Zn-ribbon protein
MRYPETITMPPQLATLLEIQTVEQRLREVDAEIAALPRRVAEIESKLHEAQKAREQTRAAQAGNAGERRAIDSEIDSLRAKISKIRSHSGEVKTNQEYKALLDEIAFAEAQIGKHEERLLEIMEDAEALERQAASAQQTLAEREAEVARESAAAQQRAAADRALRGQLAAERDRLRAQADERWLRRFDQVLRMRSHALVAVDREACSGCRVRLRPQFLQEMNSGSDRLFVCESCGRILYLEPEPVAAPQP